MVWGSTAATGAQEPGRGAQAAGRCGLEQGRGRPQNPGQRVAVLWGSYARLGAVSLHLAGLPSPGPPLQRAACAGQDRRRSPGGWGAAGGPEQAGGSVPRVAGPSPQPHLALPCAQHLSLNEYFLKNPRKKPEQHLTAGTILSTGFVFRRKL